MTDDQPHTPETCKASIEAVKDTLYVLSGKWKLPLIAALSSGAMRFKEIGRALDGITPKVLSKELRTLEINGFVERKVYNSIPVSVTYQLTVYSDSLAPILNALREWGMQHRKRIVETTKSKPGVIL